MTISEKKKGARGAETTRDALMNAATELFAARGFDGTKVEQIADKAGANKALISYHFGGKQGLYNEILAATFTEASRRFRAIEESEAPADERLREFIQTFADMATLRPALPTMVLREVLSGGLHVDDQLLPQFLALFRVVQGIVDQGIEDGTFLAVNPYLTHINLLGSLVFFFAFRPLSSKIGAGRLPTSVPEVREFVKHLQSTMSRALRPSEGDADLELA